MPPSLVVIDDETILMFENTPPASVAVTVTAPPAWTVESTIVADELVVVAAAGQEIKVIANCAVHFHRGTPIYDSPLLIRNHSLGDKVAATLGDRTAVLLRGHGGTVVASNLDMLLRRGVDFVKSARIQIMAAPLGHVKTTGLMQAGATSIFTFPRSLNDARSLKLPQMKRPPSYGRTIYL